MVDDRLNRDEAVREHFEGWNPAGDACIADLAFRPHQTLRQGGLGRQKGARNLGSGEATLGPEGQREAGVLIQGRVATGKDESQTVVGHGLLFCKASLRNSGDEVFGGRRQRLSEATATAGVNSLPPRDGRQPGRRIPRDTGSRPYFQRFQESILECLFGCFK